MTPIRAIFRAPDEAPIVIVAANYHRTHFLLKDTAWVLPTKSVCQMLARYGYQPAGLIDQGVIERRLAQAAATLRRAQLAWLGQKAQPQPVSA